LRIRQRQQDLHQGQAVGDAVMQYRHQRAAALIIVHTVEAPQRMRVIERLAHQIAHQPLKFRPAAGRRQAHLRQVIIQIETLVQLPTRQSQSQQRIPHPLPETIVDQQALVYQLDQT
jgi:hypothetical protein